MAFNDNEGKTFNLCYSHTMSENEDYLVGPVRRDMYTCPSFIHKISDEVSISLRKSDLP
jgi:hypothetical protein